MFHSFSFYVEPDLFNFKRQEKDKIHKDQYGGKLWSYYSPICWRLHYFYPLLTHWALPGLLTLMAHLAHQLAWQPGCCRPFIYYRLNSKLLDFEVIRYIHCNYVQVTSGLPPKSKGASRYCESLLLLLLYSRTSTWMQYLDMPQLLDSWKLHQSGRNINFCALHLLRIDK